MADVFISYHMESAGKLARKIADKLETIGISCWYANRDMLPGQFVESIMDAINQCKIFLLILNEEANHSKYVFNELSNAYRRFEDGIIILPFKVGSFSVSDRIQFFLTTLQTINGGDSLEGANTEKLIQEIANVLGKKPTWALNPPINVISSGLCGETVKYTLEENGVLTVSGYGTMRDYNYIPKTYIINTPWWNYSRMLSLARIENGVTSIGNRAFSDCHRLTSVTISESVVSIGIWAFHSCDRLTSVKIPYGVKSIGKSAFRDCSDLKNLAIPNSLISIGVSAFRDCSSLVSVKLPNSLTAIARRTFSDCVALRDITLPEQLTEIGESAFDGCAGLENIDIPDSVTSIGPEAFRNCANLKTVRVPANAEIADNAFPESTIITRRE